LVPRMAYHQWLSANPFSADKATSRLALGKNAET
jgi:hypothetical protein